MSARPVSTDSLKVKILQEKNLYFYCKINWGLTEEAQSALFLEASHRLYFFMFSLESWHEHECYKCKNRRHNSDGLINIPSSIFSSILTKIRMSSCLFTANGDVLADRSFLKAALCALKGTAGSGRLFIQVLWRPRLPSLYSKANAQLL